MKFLCIVAGALHHPFAIALILSSHFMEKLGLTFYKLQHKTFSML